jgi:hypothetical protein
MHHLIPKKPTIIKHQSPALLLFEKTLINIYFQEFHLNLVQPKDLHVPYNSLNNVITLFFPSVFIELAALIIPLVPKVLIFDPEFDD